MILKQVVCDETELTLTKEKKTIAYGKEFVIEDEARAKEILATTFKGQPVAVVVEEEPKVEEPKEVKKTSKKTNKK